jgi:lipopolysaccharide/colanic/teichoic acid biosynthesis glycosyltransferase
MTKRLFDLAVSGIALAILAVPFLLIAVLLRLASPGPVLFRQERVGRGGRIFLLYKFRTMRMAEGPQVTAADDRRITRVGAALRRWKLDELPQFWNVFRGEMSIIGPRPEVPRFVARYTLEQRKVLAQKPGLASIVQLAYADESELLRGSRDAELTYIEQLMPAKIALDLEYERIRTLRSDLGVLMRLALQTFRLQRQSRAMMSRLGEAKLHLGDKLTLPDFLTRPPCWLITGRSGCALTGGFRHSNEHCFCRHCRRSSSSAAWSSFPSGSTAACGDIRVSGT